MNKKKTSSSADERDAQDNKLVAVLSYVWILFLIPLLLKKDSKFCQFHAKQGLVIFIISLISWFPILGWLIGMAVLLVSVIGIIKAYSGEYWKIPYIYEWSEKIRI